MVADEVPRPADVIVARLPPTWDELYLNGLDAAASPATQLAGISNLLRVTMGNELAARPCAYMSAYDTMSSTRVPTAPAMAPATTPCFTWR